MKLLALIEAADHVCYRYRIQPYAAALARHGWELETLPLEKRTWRRNAQLRRAAAADVVVLQRKLLPLWQLRLLRKSARALIYDFDDALFHRDSYHPKGTQSRQRLAHFWATIYAADAVMAGNFFLRDQAAAFVPPERVHYFPTCVEPDRYAIAAHARQAGDIRLVWIGQRSTLPSLQLLQPQLAAAAERLPGLQLRVISDVFPQLPGIEVVPRTWSKASEAGELADADIGIRWLPDDPWSRGKCGLKVLQFMAAGLPEVANPVGANCQMVVDGETGFLARTPAEWAEAISTLATDPRLRARFGAAGRRRVEEQYSVRGWSDEFLGLLERLARPTARLSATGEFRRAAAWEATS